MSIGVVFKVTELLEEGRFIQDFAGLTLYVGKRDGETLNDVRIHDLRKSGVKREMPGAGGVRTPCG